MDQAIQAESRGLFSLLYYCLVNVPVISDVYYRAKQGRNFGRLSYRHPTTSEGFENSTCGEMTRESPEDVTGNTTPERRRLPRRLELYDSLRSAGLS